MVASAGRRVSLRFSRCAWRGGQTSRARLGAGRPGVSDCSLGAYRRLHLERCSGDIAGRNRMAGHPVSPVGATGRLRERIELAGFGCRGRRVTTVKRYRGSGLSLVHRETCRWPKFVQNEIVDETRDRSGFDRWFSESSTIQFAVPRTILKTRSDLARFWGWRFIKNPVKPLDLCPKSAEAPPSRGCRRAKFW